MNPVAVVMFWDVVVRSWLCGVWMERFDILLFVLIRFCFVLLWFETWPHLALRLCGGSDLSCLWWMKIFEFMCYWKVVHCCWMFLCSYFFWFLMTLIWKMMKEEWKGVCDLIGGCGYSVIVLGSVKKNDSLFIGCHL